MATIFPDTTDSSSAPDPAKGWVAGDQFTTDEGVVYTWTGYSWTTEGSGGGGDEYLPLTGGELTGPLTSTSTITAAGTIQNGVVGTGVQIYSDGSIQSWNNGNLNLYTTTDGSINAAGEITAGGYSLANLPQL